MIKMLKALRWEPRWVSYLGCVKGCLDYLGIECSWGWLYGGTGHAFIINIHDEVCPSGPTAWNNEMLTQLAPNLGYELTSFLAEMSSPEFQAQQILAWEETRKAIDASSPVFGWELQIPEYYVINGYDDTGYYYRGAEAEEQGGPLPWQNLGRTEIGMLEAYIVRPTEEANAVTVVKEGIEAALRHAENPGEWILPGYASGLEGYARWIDALEEGQATRFGQGYNAAVWAECRREAVAFLREAKGRMPERDPARFDAAIRAYQVVADKLTTLTHLSPMPRGDEGDEQVENSEWAELLREAMVAEEEGLSALRMLSQALV